MKKINIAELLKDCPKGMELNCSMYDNLYFDCIREHPIYPIVCYTIDSKGEENKITFDWYGKYAQIDTAKCVIFPKGKTTWEGFHMPFEDGDIIYTKHKLGTEFISIFQIEYERDICTYWDINLSTNKLIGNLHEGNAFKVFIEKDKVKEQRFATEEEKQKLFKAFKDNGYTWNTETKTLEKLIQSKFKVGDKVRHKNNHNVVVTITNIEEDYYACGTNKAFWFTEQDDYELVPNKFDITTLKPFDKVLVRDSYELRWAINLFGFYVDTDVYPFKCCGHSNLGFVQCIPYKGNEHLLGKTDDCKDFYKTW